MDEVFWSNVLKRWSDASENVILLKKELAKVHEERELFRTLVHNLRQVDGKESRLPVQATSSSPNTNRINALLHNERDDHAAVTDELQDAEAGLNKAKEEYRRLQQELAASQEEIRLLKLENKRLSTEHKEELAKLKAQLDDLRKVDTKRYQQQRNEVSTKVASSQSGRSAQSDQHFPRSKSEREKALEREVEDLRRSLEASQTANHDLREELTTTRDKLHKVEDSSKALLSSLVKLQTITRHSAPSISHAWSIAALRPDSRGSSKKRSYSSLGHSKKSFATVDHKTVHESPRHNDEKSMVGEITVGTHPFFPPEREKLLAKLPTIPVTEVDMKKDAFDRDFLKLALSDGMRPLINYLPKNRVDQTIISSYLCPTLNHHPWCPSSPGQHGFLFVGLGKEKDSYKSPVIRNLFVGLPKGPSKSRVFRYLGRYKVFRGEPLTVEEWHTLSDNVKLTYAKLTKEKTGDNRSPESIMQAYDQGELRVPCVLLQYMGFDDPFYAALLSYKGVVDNTDKN